MAVDLKLLTGWQMEAWCYLAEYLYIHATFSSDILRDRIWACFEGQLRVWKLLDSSHGFIRTPSGTTALRVATVVSVHSQLLNAHMPLT